MNKNSPKFVEREAWACVNISTGEIDETDEAGSLPVFDDKETAAAVLDDASQYLHRVRIVDAEE